MILDDEAKAKIDAMTRYQLAQKWRFGSDDFWEGEHGDYASARFTELGGFSPEISKSLGWG